MDYRDHEYVEAAAREIAASARIGRRGWQMRALDEARAEAAARLRAWRAAEESERARAASRAAHDAAARQREADNAAGIRRLIHGPYGRSYFGSGFAYGSVRLRNAEVSATADNGFVSGPSAVRVLDRAQVAIVTASGGDAIGEGRRWSEVHVWDPSTQTWAGGDRAWPMTAALPFPLPLAERLIGMPYREITERDAAEGCAVGRAYGGRAVFLVDVIDTEPPGRFAAWGVLR